MSAPPVSPPFGTEPEDRRELGRPNSRPRSVPAAPSPPRARAAWPWAVVAFLLCASAFTVHVIRWKGGDVSGTYYVVDRWYRSLPLHLAYPPGRLQIQDGPYDGAHFLALANDPLVRDHADDEDGERFFRARRILHAWVAHLLGAGRPEAILYTIPLATLLAVALGTFALARLLIENGRHPAWSLLNAITIGTAISLLREVTDAFAANLLLVGAYAWHKDRVKLGALFFALASLAKETSLLAPFVLGLFALKERSRRHAIALLAVPVLVVAWWAFVFQGSSTVFMGNQLGLPFKGLFRAIFEPKIQAPEGEAVTLVAMLVAATLVPIARRAAWDRWRVVALAYCGLAAVMRIDLWEEYWAYGRAFAMIPAFLLFSFAIRGRTLDLAGAIVVAFSGAFVWWHWL